MPSFKSLPIWALLIPVLCLFSLTRARDGAGDRPEAEQEVHLPGSRPLDSPPEPDTRFLGQPFGQVDRLGNVVFLCDSSTAMSGKFGPLLDKLAEAIGRLRPEQSFDVIFFGGEKITSVGEGRLLSASDENKRKATDVVQHCAVAGDMNPIPGLEAAFKLGPEHVYLVAAGEFPDKTAVIAKIRELNPKKQVRVDTMALTRIRDQEPAFAQVLQQIAKEGRGTFQRADVEALAWRPVHGLQIPGVEYQAIGPAVRPPETHDRKIVFVCDVHHAGPAVADELRQAIGGLKPVQSFNVIIAAADKPRSASPDGSLLIGMGLSKRQTYRFLDETPPSEKTNPIAAMELAFQARPTLIYFLTDHDPSNSDALAKRIAELNHDKQVFVDVIALAPTSGEGPRPAGLALLKRIADENGGEFKSVSQTDLTTTKESAPAPATRPASPARPAR